MNAPSSLASHASRLTSSISRMHLRRLVAGVLSVAIFLPLSSAALISIDRLSVGDSQLTRDTVSGLDWLDVTLTKAQPLSAAPALIGAGGLYAGFRLATVQEFAALFTNAGAPLQIVGTHNAEASKVNAARLLQASLGITGVSAVGSPLPYVLFQSSGWLAVSTPVDLGPATATLGVVETRDYQTAGTADLYSAFWVGGITPLPTSPNYGLWLVRDSNASVSPSPEAVVPDTASNFAMLGFVLAAGIAASRQRAAAGPRVGTVSGHRY